MEVHGLWVCFGDGPYPGLATPTMYKTGAAFWGRGLCTPDAVGQMQWNFCAHAKSSGPHFVPFKEAKISWALCTHFVRTSYEVDKLRTKLNGRIFSYALRTKCVHFVRNYML